MTTALPASRSDALDREVMRSAGLAQFRKSPFRVLRLSPGATAQQAVWQCDKALARARVGLALPDPDPVPWLPPGDEIELQEAAQTMESPLARLIEQLLWFDPGDDPADDPVGPELISALSAEDGRRLAAVLAAGAPASVAARINRANLRLLLGFSQLHEVGPALGAAGGAADRAELVWKARGALSQVDDPHRAVAIAAPASWGELLGGGVVAWGELLESAELADHVRGKIAALGDDLLTGDDLEAVLAGVRTRLADLLVGETRLEIAHGRLASVAQLSAIAGRSRIDAEIWLVAFRPLRTVFESELAELAPDAETGLGVIEDVNAYLDRLTTLAQRWRALDQAQLLGLSTLIDDAVQAAFARLRGAPKESQIGARFAEVLARIAEIAHSPSVQERVTGYQQRIADFASSMCHFCRVRELEPAHCAAVSSRVEVHREQIGDTIRVQYKVGARPIARCKQCALLHSFLRGAGWIAFLALATPLVLLALVHPASWFRDLDTGAGVFYLLIGVAAAFGLSFVVRDAIAGRVTPRGERRFSEYMTSKAVEVMSRDGFQSFKYDWRPGAWERVNQQGVRPPTINGAASLKSLLYVGALLAYVALRACH